MLPRLLILLPFLLSVANLPAQDTATKTEAPDWITPVSIPSTLPERPDSLSYGTWYLLYSEQLNHPAAERYYHYAYELVNESGVEDGSTIVIDFNPSYESLAFHSLLVHRNGETQDRLPNQNIEILRPETDRERLLYSNELQALIILEDVRAGDRIEYSYTLSGANPVLAGHFDQVISTSWSVPLAYQQATIIGHRDTPLHFQDHRVDIDWETSADGDSIRYEWSQTDPEIVYEEDTLPTWYSPYGYTEITSFETWREVALWANDIYSEGFELPEELQLEARKFAQLDSPSAQVMAALHFCQDEIRYTSISIGEHNYRPYPLTTVWERRFGDCKDKSRLLSALLQEIGFDAKPALVSSTYGKAINTSAPTPSCFDHVITRLRLDGQTYWLDPTMSNQRGTLETVYEPNDGFALVLDQDTTGLELIGDHNADYTQLSTTEHFLELPGNEAILAVTTTYQGGEADWMRGDLKSNSQTDFERLYLNHYAAFFPSIVQENPIDIVDQELLNRITIRETYRIREFLTKEDETSEDLYAYFLASSIQGVYADPSTKLRTMPIGQYFPKTISHKIKIDFLRDEWDFDPESRTIANEGFRFTYEVATQPKQLTLTYNYHSLSDSVAAENAPKYISDISKLEELLSYGIVKYDDPADLIAADPASGRFIYRGHLISGVTALIFSLPLTLLAIWFPRPNSPDSLTPPPYPNSPVGLSGWLALFALALCIRPFVGLTYFFDQDLLLTVNYWQALTDPSSENYHVLYRILYYGEALGQAILFNLNLASLILFFRRSRLFPRLFIATLVYQAVFTIVDWAALASIPSQDHIVIAEGLGSTIGSTIVVLLAIIYLLRSERVKNTFV